MPAVTEEPSGVNSRALESRKGKRIKTLKDLLAHCEVDLGVWEVERHVINKWEVGAKDADGEIVVEPLFQVKAWLRKRKLETVHPTIRPIAQTSKHTYRRRPYKGRIKKVLLLPDPQFGFARDMRTGKLEPFHDRRALDIAIQVAYRMKPHYMVCLGDILDLPDWSDKFTRSPEFTATTQPAVIEAAWWLRRLRQACPSSVMHLLEGNHDKRMNDAILNHLKGAYDLRAADELHLPPALSVPKLLALHEIGCHYVSDYPSGRFWLNEERMMIVHGEKAVGGSGKTASAIVNSADVTVICGHIHRLESAMRTKSDGSTIGAYSAGCLCRVDGMVPGRTKHQNWQQGFGIVHFDTETGDQHVQLIEIVNGRALVGTELYRGEDRVQELTEDTDWPF